MLLDRLEEDKVEDLIIVSLDNDYFVDNNGELQLNAFLFQEVKDRVESINVHSYKVLSELNLDRARAETN